MQSAVQTEGADRAAAASARQAEQMAWTRGDRASRRKTGRTPKRKKNEIKRHLFNIAVTVGATVLGIIGTGRLPIIGIHLELAVKKEKLL